MSLLRILEESKMKLIKNMAQKRKIREILFIYIISLQNAGEQ